MRIVLGNHDLHFLAIHEGCAPPRTKDTLSKLLKAKDCDLLSDWLRKSLAHYESVETKNGVENFPNGPRRSCSDVVFAKNTKPGCGS